MKTSVLQPFESSLFLIKNASRNTQSEIRFDLCLTLDQVTEYNNNNNAVTTVIINAEK